MSDISIASHHRSASRRWRWQIFGITWIAYAGLYLTRKSFSVAKVALGPGTLIDLSKREMAIIDTAYSVAYTIGQLVFGVAGDRLGTRRVVLAGMLLSVAAAIGMGASAGFVGFAVFFCLQGLCQATGWAPLSKNVCAFFPRHERGTVMGVWCTNYAVGGWIATIFAAWMGEKLGWRYSFFAPAGALFLVWILFLIFQRDRPEDVGLPPVDLAAEDIPETTEAGKSPPSEVSPESAWTVFRAVLRHRMVLLLGAVYFCLKPARYLFLFWGPQYVNEKLGTGMTMSAFIASCFELGGPVGAMLGGVVSDRVFNARRLPVGALSLLGLSVLLYFFDDLPPSQWLMMIAFAVIGAFTYAADSILAGTAAVDFGSARGASTASGIINGAGSMGQIIGGAIPGILPKQWGWHEVFNILAGAVLFAGIALLPKWNSVPDEHEKR